MYRLYRREGGLVLGVVCGGVGMYEARVKLTEEEAQAYEKEGAAFLDRLAARIARSTDDYEQRLVD